MTPAGRPPTLVIVCGLPGAGKTTHARDLEAGSDAIRMCPDEWMIALSLDLYDGVQRERIEALQWTQALRLLKLGVSVIIEWGTWGRAERDRLRAEAKDVGAVVELHYLTAPLTTLLERIRRRGMENPPIRREDLQKSADRFDAPTDDELASYDKAVVRTA